MKLRKGDRVIVRSGKDRGQTGEIMKVLPEVNKVVVEGVNVAKKHQRQTQTRIKGGIIDKDMPMSASAVSIVCSKEGGRPTRIAYKFDESGKKIRICRHCGEEL
jgi:large subunit ribosomal protein L24